MAESLSSLIEPPPAYNSARSRGLIQPHIASALVMFLAAIIYLAGNSRIPLNDRDEAWYAQISRTMVQTGDWVVPRFRGEVFDGKPVFAFWCQAISMKIFGPTVFAARFPSVIFGLATLALMWWGINQFAGSRRAAWTIFILATSALFVGLSKLAMIDAALLFWITLAQICLANIYCGRARLWVAFLLWVSVAMAILTKGPVVLGVLGGTVIALALMDVGRGVLSLRAWRNATRWWWNCRPWLAILILPAILAPWAILMDRAAPGSLKVTLIQYMVGPIFGKSLEGRPLMPGFYLGAIWPAVWPWTLLLPIAVWQGWKRRRLPMVRICLAAFAGPFVVNELVKQKLPHYMLPLFPPLAFLLADAIVRILRKPAKLSQKIAWKRGVIAWTIAAAILSLGPWIIAIPQFHFIEIPCAALAAFTLVSLLSAVGIALLLLKGRLQQGFLAMGASIAAVYLIAWIFILPNIAPLQSSQRASQAFRDAGFGPGDTVAMLDYEEPSFTFHLDGVGTPYPLNYLRITPPQNWPRWIILSGRVWAHIPEQQQRQFRVLGSYRSFSFGSSAGDRELFALEKVP